MAWVGPDPGGNRPLVVPFPELGPTELEPSTPAGDAALVVVARCAEAADMPADGTNKGKRD